MNDALVVLEDLGKTFGDFVAVERLNLRVKRGEIYGLLGPNGAGKTTTIKMLMGVLRPTTGTAQIAGMDCFASRAEVMRHVGYLPDEPTFYDYLRGRELLHFVGEMHGFARKQVDQLTSAWIDRFKLDDALEEFATNYSKGMKKKLALICALMHSPKVLILDEPTNGLDPHSTRELHELMSSLSREGTTVFFSTHLLDQAERLCTRAGIIVKGRLAAEGSMAELRARSGADDASSLLDVFFALTGATAAASPENTNAAPKTSDASSNSNGQPS